MSDSDLAENFACPSCKAVLPKPMQYRLPPNTPYIGMTDNLWLRCPKCGHNIAKKDLIRGALDVITGWFFKPEKQIAQRQWPFWSPDGFFSVKCPPDWREIKQLSQGCTAVASGDGRMLVELKNFVRDQPSPGEEQEVVEEILKTVESSLIDGMNEKARDGKVIHRSKPLKLSSATTFHLTIEYSDRFYERIELFTSDCYSVVTSESLSFIDFKTPSSGYQTRLPSISKILKSVEGLSSSPLEWD